ncbi:MAG: hypothetical protein NT079_02915 [Candidatus Omnitrophica bacterium]|nr:hypothetical protein [Candidatus Omnitrophota bacterium]
MSSNLTAREVFEKIKNLVEKKKNYKNDDRNVIMLIEEGRKIQWKPDSFVKQGEAYVNGIIKDLVAVEVELFENDTRHMYRLDLKKGSKKFVEVSSNNLVVNKSASDVVAPTRTQREGGINLDSKNLDMKVSREGSNISSSVLSQPIETMNIQGFSFTIMSITPVVNLFSLSGIEEPKDTGTLTSQAQPVGLDPADKLAVSHKS